MEKERLFTEFPSVATEDWKNKIIEDLKGVDYDKKMIWKTGEGFNVKPFYRKEDLPDGYEAADTEFIVKGICPRCRK